MKRIDIVRDKENNPYLMIKLSRNELFQLGEDIQALKILMEKQEN